MYKILRSYIRKKKTMKKVKRNKCSMNNRQPPIWILIEEGYVDARLPYFFILLPPFFPFFFFTLILDMKRENEKRMKKEKREENRQ